MADENYQPSWKAELTNGGESVQEHLITKHGQDRETVYRLGDLACWEMHDQLHEAVLGGTLVGGR